VTKQIIIEFSDDKWDTHMDVVGEIIGAADFIEANVQVEKV
jgi:hypothetical protein